jgi:serine/threonine protein kinase
VDESYDMGSYDPEMDGYVPPEISLRALKIGDKIGEGSFSEVYRGVVEGDDGTCVDVIAKAYKKNVRGRDWFSFYADERATLRRLAEVNCSGVAPFMGVCGSDAYLVWKDVGVATLETCLSKSNDAEELYAKIAEATSSGDVSDVSVAPRENATKARAMVFLKIARSLIEATMAVHEHEVVHRDVKPENVLCVARRDGDTTDAAPSVVLVDLGAAADFVTGVNCDPSETIFDPTYGAPEQFVKDDSYRPSSGTKNLLGNLFGKSVKMPKSTGLSASGVAATPRLDAFAVGLTLLRLFTPTLYPADAMRRARVAMDAAEDRIRTEAVDDAENVSVLEVWAQGPGSESLDFALVDAAEAWSLIDGLAAWDPEKRLTLGEALDHPCFDKVQ